MRRYEMVKSHEDFNKIIEYLDKNIKPNDLVISIGAGPINANVTKKLIEK